MASQRRANGRIGLGRQLAVLEACDVKLAPGVTPEILLMSFDREELEEAPYRLLLTAMGGEKANESTAAESRYFSDNVWRFDVARIDGDRAYAFIARRLRTLAQGELPLWDISDFVDREARQGHVDFRLGEQEHRWKARVEGDRVDLDILSKFARLLETVGNGRRFTYIDAGGQACLIGCSTAAERERLVKQTGLDVDWLK